MLVFRNALLKFLPPRRQTVGHIMESWVIAVGDFV